jgi:hypothetical protein
MGHMRATYKYLAYAIPVLVALQAAWIAFAAFGLFAWVEDGHQLTKAAMDSESASFTGSVGFMLHGMMALLVVLVALALLVVSFGAKVRGGAMWAGFVLADVVFQYLLGMLSHGVPALGLLHGPNAILLAYLGWKAAHRVATAGELATEPAVAPTVQTT